MDFGVPLMFFSWIEYIDKFYFLKTFFQIVPINESKEGSKVMKDFNKVQKLELELQDIKRTAIEIFDKARKYEIGSKERIKMEQRVAKLLQKKDEILKDMEFERLNLKRSLAYIDLDGQLDNFFE